MTIPEISATTAISLKKRLFILMPIRIQNHMVKLSAGEKG